MENETKARNDGGRYELPQAGKRRRICLLGASFETGNRGVSALAASLTGLFAEYAPEAEISLLIEHRTPLKRRITVKGREVPVEVVNLRLSPRSRPAEHLFCVLAAALVYRFFPLPGVRRALKRFFPAIRAAADADFVGDIWGGDSFSDIYGLKRFLTASLPRAAVLLVRSSMALLPQTYGPFRSRVARAAARWIMRRSAPVFARDREGEAVVAEILGPGKAHVLFCPDVAFTMEKAEPEKISVDPPLPPEECRDLVGINVSGLLFNGGYDGRNMFGLALEYREFVRKLIRLFVEKEHCRVLLVPHTFAPAGSVESDPAAAREVRLSLPEELKARVHLLQGEYDQYELKWIIGQCGFFVGSRMHACIAALSQGIPTAGVSYSRKFRGVFESVGVAHNVVDGRYVETGEALEWVHEIFRERNKAKKDLERKIRSAKEEVRRRFAELLAAECDREPTPAWAEG